MSKINYRTILNVPTARPFSEVQSNGESEHEEEYSVDFGDEGEAEKEMVSNIQADALLLALLFSFDDRQKIILLYQILREAGYNLNHEDCAKTLSLTREHYMFLLKGIKIKARKIIQLQGV